MKRLLISLAVLLAVVYAPAQPRTVLMGDSITEGWLDKHPGFFEEHGLIGKGISGQVSAQMLERFQTDVIDLHPAAVVINAGTNDIALNAGPYDPDRTFSNIVAMAEMARKADIRVLLTSVLPAARFGWRPSVTDGPVKIEALNERIRAYAKAEGMTYIDYYGSMVFGPERALNPDYSRDGVHPTLEGYYVMERLLLNALNDDETLLRGWVKTIGSDEFGGRMPMTEYEPRTLDYLVGQLKALGLEPAFGDSYLQPVQTISTVCRPVSDRFRVKGKKKRVDLLFPEDLVIWTARETDKVELRNAEFVFCGFGIDAPEFGWNDFEGVDVKGKIVIAMVNDPGFYDASLFQGRNMTYYGRWPYKFEQAQRMGAAGCLVLHNTAAASYGWNVAANHTGSNMALYDEATRNAEMLAVKGWLHEDGCRKLFAAAGVDFEEALSAAKKPGFKSFVLKAKSDIVMDVTCRTENTFNVAGVLPGTDLADEAVVFSAHWDHFGTGKPDETGDAIYNGAADNGSGMAAVLLLAKKYSQLPVRPRRSMVFLFPTLEEGGLFGSEHYCEHPAFPLEKTAACINFDCIAPEPLTRDVVVLGGGKCELDRYVEAAAGAQGRYVVMSLDNSDGWFFRMDHFNFVKRGVPSVVIEYGKDLVDPSRPNRYPRSDWYHKPSDEYREDWDFAGTIAHINMMFGVGLSVANAEHRPVWYGR